MNTLPIMCSPREMQACGSAVGAACRTDVPRGKPDLRSSANERQRAAAGLQRVAQPCAAADGTVSGLSGLAALHSFNRRLATVASCTYMCTVSSAYIKSARRSSHAGHVQSGTYGLAMLRHLRSQCRAMQWLQPHPRPPMLSAGRRARL
jgi:hypothetical protein